MVRDNDLRVVSMPTNLGGGGVGGGEKKAVELHNKWNFLVEA